VTQHGCSTENECNLVDVAPVPILIGFEGLYDRMSAAARVRGCMLMRRRVAASNEAAAHAHAQMQPAVTAREAFHAPVGSRLHIMDLAKVRALGAHSASLRGRTAPVAPTHAFVAPRNSGDPCLIGAWSASTTAGRRLVVTLARTRCSCCPSTPLGAETPAEERRVERRVVRCRDCLQKPLTAHGRRRRVG
jgi:hypothetical protein